MLHQTAVPRYNSCMFTYLNPASRIWLIALLIMWAALLFGGFLFGSADSSQRMPKWARLSSSAVLVLAGWSWFFITRQNEVNSFVLWLAIGMTFGFLGDLFMAGVLPGGRNVLGGMAAFGLGHVAYIIGIWRFGNQIGLTDGTTRWGSLIVWWMIGAAAWYFVVYRGQQPTTLHQATLPYALLLASTAGVATSLAIQQGQFTWLAIGAALFLISDLIIATQLFNGTSFYLIGDVIWLTYGPGQMLIVFSAATAVSLFGQ
ncbi:lysoplasmalogenase [Candidatus Leptofilum sp.]|uniref:lysoplasmalogenase n=1 Tax=Candidatus Leptofilum sp. TaxID=3241576 RepID=UPI003B5C33CA